MYVLSEDAPPRRLAPPLRAGDLAPRRRVSFKYARNPHARPSGGRAWCCGPGRVGRVGRVPRQPLTPWGLPGVPRDNTHGGGGAGATPAQADPGTTPRPITTTRGPYEFLFISGPGL